jgi:hypothetical protein
LQLHRGRPAWSYITLCDQLFLLVNAAVANLPHDGATKMSTGSARGGWRLADPATTRLLL